MFVDGEQVSTTQQIWSLEEAKIQTANYLMEYGLGPEKYGETKMFGYFEDLNDERDKINQYREIKQIISDNEMGHGQKILRQPLG